MTREFEGKVFVITGAAGGVGTTVTQHVAQQGVKLALWDHNEDKLNTLKSQLGTAVDPVLVPLDLTQEDAVDVAVNQTVTAFGRIDHLLHIAGGFAMPGPVHEGHLDVWHHMMTLNATATYITCGKVAKHMIDNDIQGTLTVVAAKPAQKGGSNAAAYSASKAAVLRIVESMAAELKDHRIRVNAVSPSIIDTPGNRASMGDDNAWKWVTPMEMAETMLYLSSSKSSAVTGANLEIYKWV